MNTSKPISSISYNSESFLLSTLKSLQQKNIIEFYMYIKHTGEIDIFGEREKDHIHLFIVPNERINTLWLTEQFLEFIDDNDKPLKTISWNNSKCDDWILYCLHDPVYLATKFEDRQIQYTYKDLVASDDQDLRRRYRSAYQSSGYARMKNLYQYAASGGTLTDLMRIGAVPINQISGYEEYFRIAKKDNIQQLEKEIQSK